MEPALAPSLSEFTERYFPRAGNEGVRFLHGLLQSADPGAPLPARIDWLVYLARWVRPRGRFLLGPVEAHAAASTARLRVLERILREVQPWRIRCAGVVGSVLSQTSAYAFLAETGTGRLGFLGEALDRVTRRIVPVPPDQRDLGEALERIFPEEADAEWLERVPSELVASVFDLLAEAAGDDLFRGLRQALADAAVVAALRAAARGFADDIRARQTEPEVSRSPFLRLTSAVEGVLAPGGQATWPGLQDRIGGCRRALAEVHDHLEQRGVSVDLVYRLDLIGRNLDRLEALCSLHSPPPGRPAAGSARAGLDLLAGLLRERRESEDLGGLVRTSTRQLARKIVESAGSTGEHYITGNAAEYRHMLLSAAGGGFVTAFCVALKFLSSWAALPPFFEGLAYSANYAAGFVLMHLVGFTLATKQPSVTAATLAGAIPTGRDPDLGPLAELVARVHRSQLAAVAGNLGLVAPTALLVNLLAIWRSGEPFLDRKAAEYVIHSLDPLHSGTLFYAALTGVLLWCGSVVAGFVENWVVYRRLPDAIAGRRSLRRWLGPERATRVADGLCHNLSGVAGNAVLGTLLGCVPIVGHFFGAPLDVRHVTFATGSLALAVASVGFTEALTLGLLPALLGIALVGALNLVVSFALALLVALRARDVRHEARLLPAILARLRQGPLDFLWPRRESPEAAG